MKENTQEKGLIQVDERSIFYKIKLFLKKLFAKKEKDVQFVVNCEIGEHKKNSFLEGLKNIENDETRLLLLQKQYDDGEIQEKDLTEKQVISLCNLYDKQISELRKSNEMRKKKLLEYRRKLQADN